MTSNNPQTREWQTLSNDHHLAPFSDFKQLKEKGPRIITNAKGVYLLGQRRQQDPRRHGGSVVRGHRLRSR